MNDRTIFIIMSITAILTASTLLVALLARMLECGIVNALSVMIC